MSELENLKREQENTNFWLAFIAGSMVSVPAWLQGAIDVALVLFVVGVVLFLAGLWIWVELLDRSWFKLITWLAVIAGGLFWLAWSSPEAPVNVVTPAKAGGAMFWDSNGNYIGQALPAGPNAVQVWNGRGEYVGQALKSGPNAVQFYGGDGSYQGQSLGAGPNASAIE